MADLADRIEAATEGSRELDAEIALAIGWQNCIPCDFNGIKHRMGGILNAPPFSRSVDAALSLVPEGWDWATGSNGANRGHSLLASRDDTDREIEADAATPALALCAAAIRARTLKEGMSK